MSEVHHEPSADSDSHRILTVDGRVVCDECSESEWVARLDSRSDDWHRSHLRIDLNSQTMLNSSDLNRLIRIHRRMSGHGGLITLANVGVGIREVLKITRLERVFSVEESGDQIGASIAK